MIEHVMVGNNGIVYADGKEYATVTNWKFSFSKCKPKGGKGKGGK